MLELQKGHTPPRFPTMRILTQTRRTKYLSEMAWCDLRKGKGRADAVIAQQQRQLGGSHCQWREESLSHGAHDEL